MNYSQNAELEADNRKDVSSVNYKEIELLKIPTVAKTTTNSKNDDICNDNRTSKATSIISQVLLCSILCALGTFCFLASKISFLNLLAQKLQVPKDQWYAAVGIILVVPEVVTLMRVIWGTSILVKGKLVQWPPMKSIVLGFVISFVEMAAIAFLTLEVTSKLSSYMVHPLVTIVMFLHTMLSQWKVKKRIYSIDPHEQVNNSSWIKQLFPCIMFSFGVCIFIVTVLLMVIFEIMDILEAVYLVTCITVLSVVWCPTFKSFTLYKQSSSEAANSKMCCFQTVIRIISVVASIILIIPIGSKVTLEQAPEFLHRGLFSLGQSHVLTTWVIIHCGSSFVAYVLTRVSAFYGTTRSGIMLPIILSTISTSVIFVYNCLDGSIWSFRDARCFTDEGGLIVLGVVALLWILPLLILRKKYFMPSDVLFKPEQENFITYNYCSVYFDQHLYLNYNPETSIEHPARNDVTRSRVFVCTTMYHEADYEMEQLLKSLEQISKSNKLKFAQVYLESHIFLDNGADGYILKEFAVQLLSLVELTLDVKRTDGGIYITPYGIQIVSILPGGMPLFLHLKDSGFVKSKKRWSQVMYFDYIINHRIKLTDTTNLRSSSDMTRISEHDNLSFITQTSLEIESIISFKGGLEIPVEHVEQGSINSKCGSRMSSDQGFETGDDISIMSSEQVRRKYSYSAPQSKSTDTQLSFKLNPTNLAEDLELVHSAWISQFIAGINNPMRVPRMQEIPSDTIDGTQDMSMYSVEDSNYVDIAMEPQLDDRTYILSTDADMHFNDVSVLNLIDTCNEDLRLGAACGRTFPMGKKINPIVWFQKFEYARDFWMIKSAQNIIGSVMCCPGCFSLYRVKALAEVMHLYSEPTTNKADVFTKDTGEDRWMCTLMMLRGWKLWYSNSGVNSTFCPDTIEEFIKQRRRWILSDLSNSFLVFRNFPQLIRRNGCFSLIYVLYLLQLFIIMVLSPGSTLVMLTVGLEMLINAPFVIVTPIMVAMFILYGAMCVRLSSQSQIQLTKICMLILGLTMSCVVVGAAFFVMTDIITDFKEDNLQGGEHIILIAVTGSFFYSAILHPRECYLLVHGIFYVFFFPTIHILLPVYAVCNIVDQTWGTRNNQKAKVTKVLCFPKLQRRKKKNKNTMEKKEMVDAETEIRSDQLKVMSDDEQLFWNNLVSTLIGKDVNLGIQQDELVTGLNNLRTKALVIILVANVVWVIVIGVFYTSAIQDSTMNGYAVMSGVLYGFSLFIQVIGMTVYRANDVIHKLGKAVFKLDKPIWIIKHNG